MMSNSQPLLGLRTGFRMRRAPRPRALRSSRRVRLWLSSMTFEA